MKGRVGVFIKITKEETNKVEANQLPSLCEVATLNVGDGFGELALLNSGLRLATIICKEDCYFATLNKENFKAILGFNF